MRQRGIRSNQILLTIARPGGCPRAKPFQRHRPRDKARYMVMGANLSAAQA